MAGTLSSGRATFDAPDARPLAHHLAAPRLAVGTSCPSARPHCGNARPAAVADAAHATGAGGHGRPAAPRDQHVAHTTARVLRATTPAGAGTGSSPPGG